MNTLKYILCAPLTVLFLVGCGLVKEPSQPVSSCESKAALEAFTSTIYPITTAKCATCHGRGRPPLVASPTSRRAFNQVVVHVNFDFPLRSRLVKKMTDGHCGANCRENDEKIMAAIEKWNARETETIAKTCNGNGGLIDGPVRNTPQEDPVNGRTIRANPVGLAALSLGSFNQLSIVLPGVNATLLLDAEQFTARDEVDSGSYRFRNPRIQVPAGASAVYLQDLGLSINDADDNVYTLFSSLDTAISPGETRSLSSKTTNPIPQLTDNGDSLIVSFYALRNTGVVDCINAEGFRDLVLNGTAGTTSANSLSQNCVGCHDANHPRDLSFQAAAGETYADVCARVIQRVNINSPSSSRLLTVPLTGSAGNGAFHRNFSESLDTSAWLQWIESESR